VLLGGDRSGSLDARERAAHGGSGRARRRGRGGARTLAVRGRRGHRVGRQRGVVAQRRGAVADHEHGLGLRCRRGREGEQHDQEKARQHAGQRTRPGGGFVTAAPAL
jgi:hypothetical protein